MRTLLCVGAALAAAASAHAQWVTKTPAPEIRSRAAGALDGGTFFYMGGETTLGARNVTAWKLDIASDTWTPIADLPNIGEGNGGVSNVDAAIIGTDIYLPGGWDGSAPGHTRLAVYSTTSDSWTTVTTDPVPVAAYAYSVTAIGGKLYLVGGNLGGVAASPNGYVYDPAKPAGTRWSPIAPMPIGRQYAGATEIDGKLHVGGGIGAAVTDQKNTVVVYDPIANSWTTLPPFMMGRGGPGLYNLGGQPYVVAGGWAEWVSSTELFNGTAWEAGDPVNTGVRTFASDGNESWLVKAGGWNGAYSAVTEVYELESVDCYPDCDGDNVLSIDDFVCFQTFFAFGDDYADCDGDSLLSIDDFICFQTFFAIGCP